MYDGAQSGTASALVPETAGGAALNLVGQQGQSGEDRTYRRRVALIVVVIALLATSQTLYALSIGNRFLLKDGIDWIYDVVLWLVALAIFGRGRRAEDLAAIGVGCVMGIAALHTGVDLWDKIATGRRAEVWVAGWSALTAIGLALFVLGLMLRFRDADNPLVAATWLSSRNDAISTTAFALVGFTARVSSSQVPEILLDLFVIGLSVQAAGAIFLKVREDWRRQEIHSPPGPDGQGASDVASSGH
jgi:divalent metal cation (Fe/Co/Zn/Cd) transporter